MKNVYSKFSMNNPLNLLMEISQPQPVTAVSRLAASHHKRFRLLTQDMMEHSSVTAVSHCVRHCGH